MARWVKNDHLGFVIPYRKRNIQARYFPDFIVVLDNGLQIIVEVKGQYDDAADAKAKAAQRWVQAVNRLGEHGQWAYVVVADPQKLGSPLGDFQGRDRSFLRLLGESMDHDDALAGCGHIDCAAYAIAP